MILNPNIRDQDRAEFMDKLSDAVRSQNGLIVTPWEENFITGFRQAPRPIQWFTPGRREAADKMRMKYGGEPEIGMPFPDSTVELKDNTPPADPDGCQFLKRNDDRRLMPCNAPAKWKRQNGFRYCEDCAQAVMRDLNRRGKTMTLVRI